jgi:hypothetical protein
VTWEAPFVLRGGETLELDDLPDGALEDFEPEEDAASEDEVPGVEDEALEVEEEPWAWDEELPAVDEPLRLVLVLDDTVGMVTEPVADFVESVGVGWAEPDPVEPAVVESDPGGWVVVEAVGFGMVMGWPAAEH